jgi:hypothetical protein
MYLILTASKSTYITNKIIDNKFRATDANVGKAGTLDLFKLYDESTLSGSTKPVELSRILLKFNFDSLQSLTASKIDINSSTFRARLKLFDVYAGQGVPKNFKTIVYPLSMSFGEGVGRDVSAFQDIDVANFITASYSNSTANAWFVTGANRGGLLNSTDIDYIKSGSLGKGVVDFGKIQLFKEGHEDLDIDITSIISGTLSGVIPDCGLRLSFSGSQETDTKTRFVKRFGSRHVSDPFKTPQLHISYDDSIIDHHEDFIFDVSGSLFLNNFHRGTPANILSGTAAAELSGNNCIVLRLEKQDLSLYFTGSQHNEGTSETGAKGLYSASFAVSLNNSTKVNKTQKILDLAYKSGSVEFDEYWTSVDGSVGYHTGSLKIKLPYRTSYNYSPADLYFHFMNMEQTYYKQDIARINVFIRNLEAKDKASKLPYERKSIILSQVYYRIRNLDTGKVVIPFESATGGTKLSSNSSGLSFELRCESLPAGHVYTIDLLVKDFDQNRIYESASPKFKVS